MSIQSMQIEQLNVHVYTTREQLGIHAARAAAEKIRELLGQQEVVNIIFAAAPSQNEFLASLVAQEGIEWTRVNAFHMDEYIGLDKDAPQGFGNFLKAGIWDKLPFGSVNYLDGNALDLPGECARYESLLQQYPTDIVCMGIGENCHIAFNDPHVADFSDTALVKVVDLDQACRQQQVNDGCFVSLGEVPAFALTLTVPALMRARFVYCMVPGSHKAPAVKHTLYDAVSEGYPSTILRTHPYVHLYLDEDSAETSV